MGKYILAVFTNPVAGREDEYNEWYSHQHLKDVVSVPGYVSAQRYKVALPMVGDPKYRYLAIYGMDAKSSEDVAAASQALSSTPMYVSDALDAAGLMVGVFEAGAATQDGLPPADFMMLALTEAADGREDEYDAWYDNHHMGEVASVPGFTAGQRLKLHSVVGGDFPGRNLALFTMDARDLAGAGAALQGLGAANLTKTTSSLPDKTFAAIYTVCSDKVVTPS